MAALSDIGEISERHRVRLRDAGIRTTDELLAYGASRRGRQELSKITRLGTKRITEWVKRADLMRVPGISDRYSDLLETAGVETVRDLRRRNPAKLHAAMAAVNQRRHVVARLPSRNEVEGWVATAAQLPIVIKRW